MATQRTVYLARHINENPEIIPDDFGAGLVVGTNPLDVEDGAAGYVEATWESPSLYMTQVTFRLEHDGISPVRAGDVTAIYADVSYEVSTTGSVTPSLLINRVTGTPDTRPSMGFTLYPTTWTREEKEMVLPFDPANWNGSDDPTYPWRLRSSAAGEVGSSMAVRVTYLRIIVEWEQNIAPPMRLRQRGDGLGMGAPRVRGTASRQRSTRVRGHY